MYKIYIIRNTINGKIYVGMTGQTIRKRWKRHVHNSRMSNPSQYITRAIKKHGSRAFVIRKIDSCKTRDLACSLEMIYILMYQATNPDLGYNCTFGGDGVVATPEVRAKIGAAHKGISRPQTTETRLKISQTTAGIPKPAGFGAKVSAGKRGKKMSAAICRAMSARQKGKPAPNKRTDVSDETVAAMYQRGDSIAAVARLFKTSDTTIRRRLSSLGLIHRQYKKKPKWWMQTT